MSTDVIELLMLFSSITKSLKIYFNDFDVSNLVDVVKQKNTSLGSRQASQVVDSFDELPEYKQPECWNQHQ